MIVLPAAVFVSLPAEVQYEVAERYVFSVNGDTRTNVALAVMLPTDGPYQRVENLAVSWKGSLEKSAIGTLEVLEMEGFLGGSGSAAAIVSYSVFLRQGSVRWTASDEPCYL
ncbi:MAG: hypothetical protein JW929_06015 [Anaerolineales bacterium]|nr:hypothetical protein [Anaerolineales bacterium]